MSLTSYRAHFQSPVRSLNRGSIRWDNKSLSYKYANRKLAYLSAFPNKGSKTLKMFMTPIVIKLQASQFVHDKAKRKFKSKILLPYAFMCTFKNLKIATKPINNEFKSFPLFLSSVARNVVAFYYTLVSVVVRKLCKFSVVVPVAMILLYLQNLLHPFLLNPSRHTFRATLSSYPSMFLKSKCTFGSITTSSELGLSSNDLSKRKKDASSSPLFSTVDKSEWDNNNIFSESVSRSNNFGGSRALCKCSVDDPSAKSDGIDSESWHDNDGVGDLKRRLREAERVLLSEDKKEEGSRKDDMKIEKKREGVIEVEGEGREKTSDLATLSDSDNNLQCNLNYVSSTNPLLLPILDLFFNDLCSHARSNFMTVSDLVENRFLDPAVCESISNQTHRHHLSVTYATAKDPSRIPFDATRWREQRDAALKNRLTELSELLSVMRRGDGATIVDNYGINSVNRNNSNCSDSNKNKNKDKNNEAFRNKLMIINQQEQIQTYQALRGLIAQELNDPHSRFLAPSELEQMSRSFDTSGVGLNVGTLDDLKDKAPAIAREIENAIRRNGLPYDRVIKDAAYVIGAAVGSSSYNAGVRQGDVIIAIQTGSAFSTSFSANLRRIVNVDKNVFHDMISNCSSNNSNHKSNFNNININNKDIFMTSAAATLRIRKSVLESIRNPNPKTGNSEIEIQVLRVKKTLTDERKGTENRQAKSTGSNLYFESEPNHMSFEVRSILIQARQGKTRTKESQGEKKEHVTVVVKDEKDKRIQKKLNAAIRFNFQATPVVDSQDGRRRKEDPENGSKILSSSVPNIVSSFSPPPLRRTSFKTCESVKSISNEVDTFVALGTGIATPSSESKGLAWIPNSLSPHAHVAAKGRLVFASPRITAVFYPSSVSSQVSSALSYYHGVVLFRLRDFSAGSANDFSTALRKALADEGGVSSTSASVIFSPLAPLPSPLVPPCRLRRLLLVLDLRGNGGGLVSEAAALVGCFIPKGAFPALSSGSRILDLDSKWNLDPASDGSIPIAMVLSRSHEEAGGGDPVTLARHTGVKEGQGAEMGRKDLDLKFIYAAYPNAEPGPRSDIFRNCNHAVSKCSLSLSRGQGEDCSSTSLPPNLLQIRSSLLSSVLPSTAQHQYRDPYHNHCNLSSRAHLSSPTTPPYLSSYPYPSAHLIVLIDRKTASAAEITAAALQDYKVAIIAGDGSDLSSFGKGTIQSIFQLPSRSGLALTTGRYLSPLGREIHRCGIKPDVSDLSDEKLTAQPLTDVHFEVFPYK